MLQLSRSIVTGLLEKHYGHRRKPSSGPRKSEMNDIKPLNKELYATTESLLRKSGYLPDRITKPATAKQAWSSHCPITP